MSLHGDPTFIACIAPLALCCVALDETFSLFNSLPFFVPNTRALPHVFPTVDTLCLNHYVVSVVRKQPFTYFTRKMPFSSFSHLHQSPAAPNLLPIKVTVHQPDPSQPWATHPPRTTRRSSVASQTSKDRHGSDPRRGPGAGAKDQQTTLQ